MKIVHIAIWTRNIERLRTFYETYFQALYCPRRTGDGYYESVVFDPDGNRIEITGAPE